MKKLMFYCQHILGIGHLVRSMEIVRGLLPEFEVCFINGGEVVPGFQVPAGVNVVNLPAIKTDAEFRSLQGVDGRALEALEAERRKILLTVFELFQPDVLMIELFPFGRRRFSFELIPLLDQARQGSTRVVCSLRDIVVTKQDPVRHEEKVCKLINRYFDQVLIHGDPQFQPLEESFSRVQDLNCQVFYTGYVVQPVTPVPAEEFSPTGRPQVLVSVGGGRFGHELIECVLQTAPLLADRIPHEIRVFSGPFCPEETFADWQSRSADLANLTVQRYTPHLVGLMQQADLSISMAGYNTTMNVLTTGVRAMMLAFTGNDDQEQQLRSEKLASMGIINTIHAADLDPVIFAEKVVACLQQDPAPCRLDTQGVAKTAACLQHLLQPQIEAVA